MKYIIWFSCLFLLSCKSDEDASLINKWKLDSYIKNSGSTVTNISFPLDFTFEKNNTVKVNLNINTCNGEYTKSSKTLTLKNFNCTKICCDSSVSLEAYELFIDSVKTYEINGNTLKLKGNYGTALQLSLFQ